MPTRRPGSSQIGGDLVGNAWWSGVRVAELLAEAGVHADADAVLQTSADDWTCGTPLSALTDERNALLPDYRVAMTECASQIGSGSLPTDTIPSAGLRITGVGGDAPDRLAAWLRDRPRPVIGHIRDGGLILDLRCLGDDRDLLDALS